jgi:hypothetical protein
MLFKSPVINPKLTACAPTRTIEVFISPIATLSIMTSSHPGHAKYAAAVATPSIAATNADTRANPWSR